MVVQGKLYNTYNNLCNLGVYYVSAGKHSSASAYIAALI